METDYAKKYESCPHCRASFSFNPPMENKCPWCFKALEEDELSYEEKREIYNRKSAENIRDAINVLFNELNAMGQEGHVEKVIVESVQMNHRTLQQNFFSHLVVPLIKDFAKRYDSGNYDLRNEDSCRVAKKLEPILKDEYFRFI